MHHSKFVTIPALWYSVLKLKQVTRFAVALVMHTIAFGQYSFDVRAAQRVSRTGDPVGALSTLRLGVLLPPGAFHHATSCNPEGEDIVPECHGSTAICRTTFDLLMI